ARRVPGPGRPPIAAAREPWGAVEPEKDPPREGRGVAALVAGRAELEPIAHAGSRGSRREDQAFGDAPAPLHVEAARSQVVLVEDAEHLLAHALLEPWRHLEGEPTSGGRESFEVEEPEHRHDDRQPDEHRRPPLLQAHGDGGVHARDLELAREGAVGVGHFESGPARQPDHPRRALERFGNDGTVESAAIHQRAVGGLDHEVAVVDVHDDRDRIGMASVEANGRERGLAHSPMSNPNASVAPSPAPVTGRATTLAASADSGTLDSTWTHWIR